MQEIYLDNCATTRVDEDTAAVAMEMMCGEYGNPSSLHSKGLSAQLRLDHARQQVASALGCTKDEVVFTSGGTEANNLAVLGGADALRRRGKTAVVSATEHSSVLESMRYLEEQGYTIKRILPLPTGRMDAQAMVDAVDDDTVLVSCMMVNSEVGAVNPIAEIVRGVKKKNPHALVHCDAVQAFGKLPFSAAKLGVDLLSVSSHKIHSPKGCGALYIRKGVRIRPRSMGGGHEHGLRSGTENVPGICAFGYAAEKMSKAMAEHTAQVTRICEHFVNNLGKLEGVCRNSPSDATPYLCNISLPGYRSEILLHYLAKRGIYVSSGSACSKGAPSHVLKAMGLSGDRMDSALRISFCKDSTTEQVDILLDALAQAMKELQPIRRAKR